MIEIKVNAGFFKKLAAFFKGIFGLLPNVEVKPDVEAKETVYTLSYNANGGIGVPAKQTGFGIVTISSTQPTREGYLFLGWATDSSAVSSQYNTGESFMLSKDSVLYAIWAKKGDLNMDGEISLVDLTRLRGYLAGTVGLSVIQQEIADLNNDGSVDETDLALMRQLLVGITA